MSFRLSLLLLLSSSAVLEASYPDRCYMMRETGPCKALYWRFAYNANSGRCQKFIYGGCRGNANKFESISDCYYECGGAPAVPSIRPAFCYLAGSDGKFGFPAYFFNATSGHCEKSQLVELNGNKFNRMEDCKRVCLG